MRDFLLCKKIYKQEGEKILVENQLIESKWSCSNKKHLISKGYVFTKMGESLFVKPEDLPSGSHLKVNVKCDYCGKIVKVEWRDYFKYKYDKYSCKKCRQRKTSEYNLKERQLSLYTRALDFCNKKGYTLLTQKDEIKNSDSIVKYECKKHGVFETKIYALISQHGCSKCQNEEKGKNLMLSPNEVEERIAAFGGKLLNKNEYKGWEVNNLIVVCPNCNKPYTTSLFQFTRHENTCCRKCSRKESLGEYNIRKYLSKLNINYIQEHRFDNCKDKLSLPFDFYLPDHNICIEYQGLQHFSPIKYFGGYEDFIIRKNHDKIKKNYCIKNDIKLIEITYRNYKYIDKILDTYFTQ